LPGEPVVVVEKGGRLLPPQEGHRPQRQARAEEVTTDRLEARGGEGISLAQERDRAVGGDRSHAVSIRRAHGGSGTERSGTPCDEGEPSRRCRCPTGLPHPLQELLR